MAAGSRKAKGSFWIATGQPHPHQIVITESAIDTLSAFLLTATRGVPTVYLSTSGVTAILPDWIRAWNPKRIYCGFDADAAGDDAARRLIARDPAVVRLRPGNGAHDWNDWLCGRHTRSAT